MNYVIICGISISNIINRVICCHEENIESSIIFDYSIKKIYNMFSELTSLILNMNLILQFYIIVKVRQHNESESYIKVYDIHLHFIFYISKNNVYYL